jgi:hypothetical protein
MSKIIDSTNITPITISNNLFMCGADQWAPKGVCYQPTDFVDPISDTANLATIQSLLSSDTTYGFTNMKLNAIRIYQVDPTKDHMKVMDAFAAAGIYILIGAVNNIVTVFSSTAEYHARLEAIADEFCQYKNVLGFSLGNESIGSTGHTPGYDIPGKIRAGAKHLKTYMTSKSYRAVPLTAALRDQPANTIPAGKAYMCGDASERLDFLGYNCERWAGGSLAAKVGAYYDLAKAFDGSNPVPITFTEMGSNPEDISPRTWEQVPYLFGVNDVVPQSGTGSLNMADIVSGGFAFRYYERASGWGMLTPAGAEIPGHGAKSMITEYTKITTFSSTGNTMGTKACDSSNPYVSGGTGGLAADTTIIFTFEVADSTSIVLNYSMESSGDNWVPLLTGTLGDDPATGTLPQGTKRVSVAYKTGGSWYNACSITDATVIKANDTIVGGWVSPNGEGACAIT